MSTMPVQKPGRSEQIVCTPTEFLASLKRKLGIEEFEIDLAASEENAVAGEWYTEEDDALIQGWARAGWAYCNPPYSDIEPWVAKAYTERGKGASVAMLLPASVGSNWWKAYVHNKAYVLLINGRLTFVGHTSPYPKDLIVALYTPYGPHGYDVWSWK